MARSLFGPLACTSAMGYALGAVSLLGLDLRGHLARGDRGRLFLLKCLNGPKSVTGVQWFWWGLLAPGKSKGHPQNR